MPGPTIEAAADVLLKVIMKNDLDHPSTVIPEPIHPGAVSWHDPTTIPRRGELNLSGLVSDPIGTACRAELRRIGTAIHAASGSDALDDAVVSIAEMDMAHADWRAILLKSVWTGIGDNRP